MFDILQEILQCHPFLMLKKFETQGCQWYRVKGIKSIFADRGSSGKRLGLFFITSSSPHFFNKTNFELYLLK